jgi:hypothetical protein
MKEICNENQHGSETNESAGGNVVAGAGQNAANGENCMLAIN